MYDKEFVREIIGLIEESLETILKRTIHISCVNDFLKTESNVILLDSVCMKLIAIGESIIVNNPYLCNG